MTGFFIKIENISKNLGKFSGCTTSTFKMRQIVILIVSEQIVKTTGNFNKTIL